MSRKQYLINKLQKVANYPFKGGFGLGYDGKEDYDNNDEFY